MFVGSRAYEIVYEIFITILNSPGQRNGKNILSIHLFFWEIVFTCKYSFLSVNPYFCTGTITDLFINAYLMSLRV